MKDGDDFTLIHLTSFPAKHLRSLQVSSWFFSSISAVSFIESLWVWTLTWRGTRKDGMIGWWWSTFGWNWLELCMNNWWTEKKGEERRGKERKDEWIEIAPTDVHSSFADLARLACFFVYIHIILHFLQCTLKWLLWKNIKYSGHTSFFHVGGTSHKDSERRWRRWGVGGGDSGPDSRLSSPC